MADLPICFKGIPNAEPKKSILNSFLKQYFHHKHFKNTTQRDAIAKILKRESDVIVSLPKGNGRTTCFQLPILLCEQKVSIVFVSLSSRINMQITRLNRRDVYVEIIDTEMSTEEFDYIKDTIQSLSNIRSTLNTILYVTPGVASNTDFLNFLHHLVETYSLGMIVVDAAYCENEWISGQTEEYYALRSLRDTYSTIPWVVTTQKASYKIVNCFMTKLLLRTHRPNNPWDSIPCFAINFEDDDVPVDR